jgi:hypothetical protein
VENSLLLPRKVLHNNGFRLSVHFYIILPATLDSSNLRIAADGHAIRTSALIAAFFVLALAAPASAHLPGRMTGGGSIQCGDVGTVTHGFELHCIADNGVVIEPNNLEINWDTGDNFHLTTLDTAVCSDSPLFDEGQPPAGFNTMEGSGTGTFNNVPGATIQFILIDNGEPGAGADLARYFITDASGTVVLDCPLTVLEQGGNHQAHKLNGP